MSVLSYAFCRDDDGNFGLVRAFDHGWLTVTFDFGTRRMRPCELTFI
jgi:hypothetical protein